MDGKDTPMSIGSKAESRYNQSALFETTTLARWASIGFQRRNPLSIGGRGNGLSQPLQRRNNFESLG